MAEDWIKMRTDLFRHPKVCLMADRLMTETVTRDAQRDAQRNVTRNAVVGALVTVWGVMRHRGERIGDDMRYPKASRQLVDDLTCWPGFGAAMVDVQWLLEVDGDLVFPEFFAQHNVEIAGKKKGTAAERQARYRERLKARNVTGDVAQRDAQRVAQQVAQRDDRDRERVRDLEQQPGQPLRLKVQNPNLRIPAAVNTPTIWEAITLWANHLDQMTAPHTLWQENSPQLAALFGQANEWGELRFLAAMQWSMANGRYILAEAFEAKPNGKPARARKPDPGADEVWLHVLHVLNSTDDGPQGRADRERMLLPEQREAVKRAMVRSRLENCKCEKDRNDIAASFLETLKIVTFERQSSSSEIEAMGVF